MVQKEQARLVRVRDAEILRVMVEDRGWKLRPLELEVQRQLRKKRQPTIGASRSTLSNLMTGDAKNVRASVAKALSEVLGVKWQSLFSDEVCTVSREVAQAA